MPGTALVARTAVDVGLGEIVGSGDSDSCGGGGVFFGEADFLGEGDFFAAELFFGFFALFFGEAFFLVGVAVGSSSESPCFFFCSGVSLGFGLLLEVAFF